MTRTRKRKQREPEWSPEKSEQAMIEGILEGSPDAIGVAVVRLNCGCRKMAAIAADGEPASKVIMYRDKAASICTQCKEDNGAYQRTTASFIDWKEPEPAADTKKTVEAKVFGSPAH